MDKFNVAAVVVWYKPVIDDALRNIETYLAEVERLWIIDNSEDGNWLKIKCFLSENPSVDYVSLGENKGIATALNCGFRKAIDAKYDWVLTLDQDSSASVGMVPHLCSSVKKLTAQGVNLGILAAQPDTPTRAKKSYSGYTKMDSVIASGNLVSVKAYEDVGGFVDALFIDVVDCEFSLAIRRAKYEIYQDNAAVLHHNLGQIVPKSLFGIKMYPTNHAPIRFYYYTRNRLYVREKYRAEFPEFIRWESINYLKWWIKVLLFEKDKMKKIGYSFRGWRDFKRKRFGIFQ